ncbi:MAG: UvrD-helicase domain-containing protein [Opitutae bacterium]|nr:UvrD-helicase domain-containing protein [Opitutae bacterium]
MSEPLHDQRARDRFRDEWDRNFAVSANAGSGKTTAISERLAALALAPHGAELLKKTAVVTFTKKAAAQIGRRARAVLLRRLRESGRADLAPLDHLERTFFGTIHSFCLLLAQRHGQTLGLNLNPAVVAENDDALWEEFLEQDSMLFTALSGGQAEAFLRHAPLESIFALARRLDLAAARGFAEKKIAAAPPPPAAAVLQEILAARTKTGKSAEALKRNQETAARWQRRFQAEKGHLPFPRPEGTAAGIKELYARFCAPLKSWLAEAGAVLAAELALRYRAWRFERGVQTYADQVEAAHAVLAEAGLLDKIRAEGWRVVLDEAQDTDPQQFSVLVEITRPGGAAVGSWPGRGPGPRPGHFCMVGDGQQSIYGSRADIRNFQKHLDAFARGEGGERLTFGVTFRTPHRVIERLNATLPAAFSAARGHNLGLPAEEGAPAPMLQAGYEPLAAGPDNVPGAIGRLPLGAVEPGSAKVGDLLALEARRIAAWLRERGPAGVGARDWGEVCLLAPRNDWLITARKELESAGLKTALQMRKNRNGDNAVFAWITGLLAAVADPENSFEWTGVLREVFGISDAVIAVGLRAQKKFHWDEPERHAGPVRGALAVLRPFVERVDAEAGPLARFAAELAEACGLAGKARAVDASGGLEAELERLLHQAADSGLEGAGPREWLRQLLATREDGRPAGKPSEDAINLLTSHSAKGLEWPVVIPIGLWRRIGKAPEDGLRFVPDPAGELRVYFDGESVPAATREARERERLRELVRLLYVTLTRARRTLVLPWSGEFAAAQEGSLAGLWGATLDNLPELEPALMESAATAGLPHSNEAGEVSLPVPKSFPAWPARLLPHQLAHKPDLAREARHESALAFQAPGSREDPVAYGLWWHETMEFLPWRGNEAEMNVYMEAAVAAADRQGFAQRARRELGLFQASGLWRELRSMTGNIFTELSVVAPLDKVGWVDGVVDLVAESATAEELWVIDWKSNQLRRGETPDELLLRLLTEYRPQLLAYGACLGRFFPSRRIKTGIYSTTSGAWQTFT